VRRLPATAARLVMAVFTRLFEVYAHVHECKCVWMFLCMFFYVYMRMDVCFVCVNVCLCVFRYLMVVWSVCVCLLRVIFSQTITRVMLCIAAVPAVTGMTVHTHDDYHTQEDLPTN
jgi:hypothetical protein